MLKDRDPQIIRTAVPGCLITRLAAPAQAATSDTITYSSHIGKLVQDISYNNAANYFGIDVPAPEDV